MKPGGLQVPPRILSGRVAELQQESSGNDSDTPCSTEGGTPFSGRNELFRLTSVRRKVAEAEFWGSLPVSSKAHLVMSGLAAVSILVFCIQQLLVGQELLHVLLAELLSAAFFVWMVVEAVYHENAFELLASAIVAVCIAARIIYFLATMHHTTAQLLPCLVVLVLLALDLCLALASYGQFGWRFYSKIACDMRAKDGKSKRKTYLLIHLFLTVLKLDLQLLLILFLIAVSSGATLASPDLPLLLINPLGLVLCGAWLAAVFVTVRNDLSKLELPLMVALPFCYVMPVFDIALAFAKRRHIAVDSKVSIVLAAAAFLLLRSLAAILVQVLISRFRFVHAQRMHTLSDTKTNRMGITEDVPAVLVPLMKGAWIGKPSAGGFAQKKRRFFQLSTDGSTLRWAWDKYILLYYVEAQVNDDTRLEIVLKMAMEPELRLRFHSLAHYEVWKAGLEAIRRILELPTDVLHDDLMGSDKPLFAGTHDVPHGLLRVLLLESSIPSSYTVKHALKQVSRHLSCSRTQRHSVRDPKLKHFHAAKAKAQDLYSLGVNAPTSEPGTAKAALKRQGAQSKSPDPRHKRGSTIPSIQEFLDAIEQQDQSPPRQGSSSGLVTQKSFGKRCKELVIDCISPNTKQVRVLSRSGSPRGIRQAARVLFPEKSASQAALAGVQGPPQPGCSLPDQDKLGSPSSGSRLYTILQTVDVQQPPSFRQLADSNGGFQIQAAAVVAACSQPEPLSNDQMVSEAIDSRECLDTVGPLPGETSRPPSAALPKHANTSPTKLAAQTTSEAIVVSQGQAVLQCLQQKDGDRVEVVIHEPVTADSRSDAVSRSSGDATTTSFAVHPLIQRTRTTSSSGSFYGPSPLQSQGNSGNYTSECSYATSLQSQSTISSSVSLYSNGPVKMSVPFVPIHEITIGRCLGEGSEGVVYAGSYLETPVAIKQLSHVQEMEMNLHIGSHDNVVALRGISRRDENLILVMEYCPKGTLHLLLHGTAQSELDAYKLVSWVRAIARGMLHLHTRKPPILHRDLKPANIFVGHGFMMKIGDFGMSRHVALTKRPDGTTCLVRQLSSGVIGTAAYAAPELLEGCDDLEEQNLLPNHVETILKSDVYSFGVTLWEMMARKRPFGDMMSYQIHHAWMVDPQDMQLPPVHLPAELSPQASQNMEELAALIHDCTQPEAAKRPSFHEICLRLKHLPPRSSSVLASPMACDSPATRGSLHSSPISTA